MISVDEESMAGEIIGCDLWHSFAQYIETDGSDLYILEQSEGSWYTKLSRFDTETSEEKSIAVLPYGGTRTSSAAISCYASVDDFCLSTDNTCV